MVPFILILIPLPKVFTFIYLLCFPLSGRIKDKGNYCVHVGQQASNSFQAGMPIFWILTTPFSVSVIFSTSILIVSAFYHTTCYSTEVWFFILFVNFYVTPIIATKHKIIITWWHIMAWYDGMIRWHDTMAWYNGMIQCGYQIHL